MIIDPNTQRMVLLFRAYLGIVHDHVPTATLRDILVYNAIFSHWVMGTENRTTVRHLSAELRIPHGTVSRIITRLMSRGSIEPRAIDGRSKCYLINTDGQARAESFTRALVDTGLLRSTPPA